MHRVPADTLAFPVVLQRNSFGPRLVARPGDVWRSIQDVVVDQSTSVGWSPERFVAANTMFVVRTMAVVHAREVRLGEALVGRTWPSKARRDMLFTREARLFSGGELVAAATQEWAYLTRDLVPTRAGRDVYEAFSIRDGFPSVELPPFEAVEHAPVHHFRFHAWHTWMDALAHLNHPAYLDVCDEGTSRAVAAAGLGPQALSPVAEQVHFRAAIAGDDEVAVETWLKGRAAGAAVLAHRLLVGEKVCATATTVRRLVGGDGGRLVAALGG